MTVALLWLELGRELGLGEFSRLRLTGLAVVPPSARLLLVSALLRLLVTELPLVRPGGDCTLHRLLTLSDLFIIALCTKPPMPFVGDGGLSTRSGEIRPWEGDIARLRPPDPESRGGSSF